MASLTYNHPISRNIRSIKRMVRYYRALNRSRPTKVVQAFWWDQHPNFGDLLTELILPAYSIAPVIVAPEKAELFGIGSVIEMSPKEFNGFFWSSGKMYGERDTPRPHATFLAVRGTGTRKALGLSPTMALGDGGLLTPKVVPAASPSEKVGFIPHFTHQNADFTKRITQQLGNQGILIDVSQGPAEVARQISSCSAVFSTSLHGVILADAYGVPACWALPEPVLGGGDYKFLDYESVFTLSRSRRVSISQVQGPNDIIQLATTVPADQLQEVQASLEEAIETLYEQLDKEVGIAGVIKAQFQGPLSQLAAKLHLSSFFGKQK